MKLSLLSTTSGVHTLVFGEPKTGKSLLAAKLALAGFKILWISLDGGYRVITEQLPASIVEEQFEFIVLPDTLEFAVAYGTIIKLLSGKACHICDSHGQVDCSICRGKPDRTYTDVELPTLGKEWIIVLDHATHLTKSAANFYAASKNLKEDYKFEFDDWRMLGVMMDKVFLSIQNSKNNWVVISHVFETKMEDGKNKLVPAIGTGNYARNSAGFFDHVVYCDVANMRHNFGSSTTFRANVITGSRSDIAIEKLVDGKNVTKEASLVPFFTGVIPKKEKFNGMAAAEKVLNSAVTPTPAPVVTPVPVSVQPDTPAAGQTTSMHAPVVSTNAAAAVSTLTQADKAAAMLASLRGMKR